MSFFSRLFSKEETSIGNQVIFLMLAHSNPDFTTKLGPTQPARGYEKYLWTATRAAKENLLEYLGMGRVQIVVAYLNSRPELSNAERKKIFWDAWKGVVAPMDRHRDLGKTVDVVEKTARLALDEIWSDSLK